MLLGFIQCILLIQHTIELSDILKGFGLLLLHLFQASQFKIDQLFHYAGQ
jgi:hypothetical protein